MADVSLLNTKAYASYFGFTGGKVDIQSNYIWSASDAEIDKFGALNINPATAQADDTRVLTDTPVEFALLSYYSQPVVKIRPIEAERVLPAGDARLSTLKLGAVLYQDIVVLRFLDTSTGSVSGSTGSVSSSAIGRYEGMLKFICDENGVTRTEVENYFKAGIRGLVSEIVNEEFNKISFLLRGSTNGAYNTVLTRNPQNGHYTLSYEGYFNDTKATKALSGQTLEALLSAMRNSRDFTLSNIDTVRDQQAQRIPAVVYSDWHAKGVARGADAMKILVDTLTEFYLRPTRANYEAVRGIYARYEVLATLGDPLADVASRSYVNTISSLSESLYSRVTSDANPDKVMAQAKIPDDPLYNVFATRYSIGGER